MSTTYVCHKYGPSSKALRAHALDSKRWSKKGPLWSILGRTFWALPKIGVSEGSEPRSHPSPAVPGPLQGLSGDIKSPKDAGLCFHPALLPPVKMGLPTSWSAPLPCVQSTYLPAKSFSVHVSVCPCTRFGQKPWFFEVSSTVQRGRGRIRR